MCLQVRSRRQLQCGGPSAAASRPSDCRADGRPSSPTCRRPAGAIRGNLRRILTTTSAMRAVTAVILPSGLAEACPNMVRYLRYTCVFANNSNARSALVLLASPGTVLWAHQRQRRPQLLHLDPSNRSRQHCEAASAAGSASRRGCRACRSASPAHCSALASGERLVLCFKLSIDSCFLTVSYLHVKDDVPSHSDRQN